MVGLAMSVKWYDAAVKNRIGATIDQRIRGAGNMIRRTVRRAMNVKAPFTLQAGGRKFYTAAAKLGIPSGSPPLRRSGRAYGRCGFDLASRTATLDRTGRVGVDNHGLETGAAGIRRPVLGPVFQANGRLVVAILEGRSAAPQYGAFTSIAAVAVRGKLTRKPRAAGKPGAFQRTRR